jgi:hypothetical protein
VSLCACATLVSCSRTVDPRAEAFASLPDWRGIWISEEAFNVGISGFTDDEGKPRSRPLSLLDPAGPWTEAGRQQLTATLASGADRKAPGWGYPMMMIGPAPLQFLVTPDETLIINIYQDVRHVYTDGRDHPKEEDRWATTWGDSIGRWEGDTLVIDTVSVREPGRYFQAAPPFSEQAHYVERLRKTAPDRIETEITVEDPQTLSKPWTLKTAFRRTPNLDRLIHDAFDNDRSELAGDAFGIAPPQR